MIFRSNPALRIAIVLALGVLALWLVLQLATATDDASSEFEFREAPLTAIDNAIAAVIDRREIPGAVLWIESHGKTHRRVYGDRALVPNREAMTEDTIFDLASLTKVLATTPAIMLLVERGQLELETKAVSLLPEMAGDAERESITIQQMMTHTSGLLPVVRRRDAWWGYDEAIRRACTSEMWSRPGEVWRYSDVNFILLGEIVRRISGRSLAQFTREEIYQPLGMAETGFSPARDLQPRIAPTEDRVAYGLIRGVVHDPVARRMDGVAGHAGLFSTSSDIAKLLRAQLKHNASSFLKAETVSLMTSVQTPPDITAKRGLGWDIGSPYSGQRGDRFPPLGGYGHTGWTGTCLWVDPGSETFYILLSNRNHPGESGKIKQLRHTVGSLVAEAVGIEKLSPPSAGDESLNTAQALNGIDVLVAENFAPLAGKRVGLITNHTGIDRHRRTTIDLLAEAENVELVALFSPEHGIRGTFDTANIDDEVDQKTGLPIHSLYKSDNKKPSAAQLKGLDALVFDIQDIGCRFYTYIATMGNSLEAAADHGIDFVVLDRINPIGGHRVEGPVRDGERKFVAWHDIPVRHGMTVGELAKMFVAENQFEVDLTVVPVTGWQRETYFDATGLPWINPSPNMRSLTEALLYPGIGLLEFTNISVGRGTDTPFEQIGAPWINDIELAGELSAAGLSGICFTPIRYTPDASVHAKEECGGVRFTITDREQCQPIDVGFTIAAALHRLYPEHYNLAEKFNVLLQHPASLAAVENGTTLEAIVTLWAEERSRFLKRRQSFLLYPAAR